MFEWFFEGMTGIGDLFTNWWGMFIIMGSIIIFSLFVFVLYIVFKSYFGV